MKSTISLRMPISYHRAVQMLAEEEKVSMNQIITSAVGEKLSAIQTESYLSERAARASTEKFKAALDKAPDVEPEPFDRIS